MASPAVLLKCFKPHLIYDSQEGYFADSAAEWTDAPGNVLQRADKTVIAAASPKGRQEKLSLDFLGGDKYANGVPVEKDHQISHPKKNYLEVYRELHPQERYRNRVYGHAVKGREHLWLQYWFFYFYNPGPVEWIPYGKHEGDWEMIQLRLDEDERPDLAVYAQHKEAGVREWQDVQKTGAGDTPVVYVARGSHASYFGPGGMGFDRADGGLPSPPLALEIVWHSSPGWIAWPGAWGDTSAETILHGQSSPAGPSPHKQWRKPDSLIPRAGPAPERTPSHVPPPQPERITVSRVGERAQVSYAFPGDSRGTATSLLVTVNSPDDRFPPATYSLEIEEPSGTVTAPLPLEPERRYDVIVSAGDDDGVLTRAVRRGLAPV